MFVFAFCFTRRNASLSGEGKKNAKKNGVCFMFVSLSDFSTVPVLFSRCQQKTRPKARWRYTQYKGLLFFNFFDEVGVFHRCCGTTCFAFVLQFIELPFQLVDQFVNCGVHIFMFTTGNQNAVRCIDCGVSNKPLWLFGQNDMWINQMCLPFSSLARRSATCWRMAGVISICLLVMFIVINFTSCLPVLVNSAYRS